MPGKGKNRLLPFIAYFNICFFWGTAHIANKFSASMISPIAAGMIRFSFVALVLVGWILLRQFPIRVSAKEFLALSASSVMLFFLNTLLLLLAARHVDASISTIVLCLIPMSVILIDAASMRRLEISWKGWVGVIGGFAGILLIAAQGLIAGSINIIGLAELLLAVVVWSCGTVFLKHQPITVALPVQLLIQSAIPAVLFFLLAVGMALSSDESILPHSFESLLPPLYLGITDSIIGMASYSYLLKRWKSSVVATYAYINPVVSLLLSALVLHEQITMYKVLGMVIILVSVIIIQFDGKQNVRKTIVYKKHTS